VFRRHQSRATLVEAVEIEPVRVDSWLSAARIFKSRTAAREACEGGLVKVNGDSVKPSQVLKLHDRVTAHAPRGFIDLEVVAFESKRQSPVRARELYLDHSPPPPPKEEQLGLRERGAGRPTKADRRALDKLRRFF
jgi:ribosome-associated heat shock protein Hsp15